MNGTFLGTIPWILWVIYMISLVIRTDLWSHNHKELRRPQFTAWDVYAVARCNDILTERHVAIKVYDVDRTLCKLGLFGRRQHKLPPEAVKMLREDYETWGFKIVLASKSNKHLGEMAAQLGNPEWLIHMVTSKSSPDFLEKILNAASRNGWGIQWMHRIAVIGDKPTDMGSEDDPNKQRAIEILTNPQGGHDIILETLVMRRWFDHCLLKGMKVERATQPSEFIRL